MKKVIAIILCIVLCATLFAACNSSTPAPSSPQGSGGGSPQASAQPIGKNEKGEWIYLCFVIRSLSNPYHIQAVEGIRNFARQLGMTEDEVAEYVQPLVYDASSEKMLQDIRTWNEKTQGNMVFGIDPSQVTDLVAIAEYCDKEGIYWCSWEKPKTVNVSDYQYWVYALNQDNFTAGYNMGKMLFDEMGGSGNVWIAAGTTGHASAIGRQAGIDAALKEYPGITVVGMEDCKWEKAAAYNAASSALVAFEIDGIIGQSDNMALGALEAIREKNLIGKVKLVGNNAIPDMLEAIKNNESAGTISNDPVFQAAMCIYAALQGKSGALDFRAQGEDLRCWKYDVIIVTPASVADYEAKMREAPDYLKLLNADMYLGKNLGPGTGL